MIDVSDCGENNMKLNKFHIAAIGTAIALAFIGWMSGYNFDHRNVNTGTYTFVSACIVAGILLIGVMG